LPNDKDAGERARADVVPVPLSCTVWGLPRALSVKVSAPVDVPAAAGVNTTLIVQLAPAESAAVQVFVWEKAPLATMLEIVSGEVPVFVAMTGIALLEVPTA